MSNPKTRLALAVMALTLAEEEAGEDAVKNRYLEYEAALERVAVRLGMTVGEMNLYLWSRKKGRDMR